MNALSALSTTQIQLHICKTLSKICLKFNFEFEI